MGRTYDAAVVSAGFGGISLGSTPTAMASMSAVAQRYGASHLAHLPLDIVGQKTQEDVAGRRSDGNANWKL